VSQDSIQEGKKKRLSVSFKSWIFPPEVWNLLLELGNASRSLKEEPNLKESVFLFPDVVELFVTKSLSGS
jgi:hypothetical protein